MIFSNNKLITAVVVSTAFLSGFALMGFEMFGVRVLAPFFGSGTPVWGAVISVVMTGMGLGYAYGGRLADSRPAVSTVAALLLPAALLMCFFPLYGKPVCRLVDSICSDRRSAALLASALLFPLIVFFLGAVSPLLVKLKVVSMSEVGVGSGIVYASGTAGGVVGTLTSAFVFLGVFSSSTSIFFLGLILFSLSCVLLIFNIRIKKHLNDFNLNP